MKKMMFLLFLLIFSSHLSSQSRLGSSFKEIKDEFSDDASVKLTEKYFTEAKEGRYIKYLEVVIDNATVVYIFNTSLICYGTYIVPANQGALNYYVELYNKRYVIISPTNWRMYHSSGYTEVELFFDENDLYYFLWSFGG
jgi:hypothetical protein